MPTRVDIPEIYNEYTLSNTPQLILQDPINNLDAKFQTTKPFLNGVHTYSIIQYDFGIIGEINKLLIIIELMANNKELLNNDNLNLYFNIISNFVFSSKYKNALIKENNSNFFINLSYFLEKIPDNYFNISLTEDFNLILYFLFINDNEFFELKTQFLNYILFNCKIFFKFNEEEQINMISTFCLYAKNKDIHIDIINIIKLLFNYDKENNYKFCCKNHANYFNDNYEIMKPELSKRIQAIEELIEIIFDKKYILNKEKLNNNNNQNKINSSCNDLNTIEKKYDENNFYLLFYILTFDISPCLQKSIISLINKFIINYTYDIFFQTFARKMELFYIILFVFTKSIFDVKIDALNLLFIIENNSKENIFENNKIFFIFFRNHFLPIFLIEEKNNFPIIYNKEEYKEKGKIDKNYNNINISNEKKSKYGIKDVMEIDGVKYYLFSPSKIQKIISQKYNMNKYNSLINNLYEKIVNYKNIDLNFKLDLLIKIVSNGSLLLIKSFLSWISELKKGEDIKK